MDSSACNDVEAGPIIILITIFARQGRQKDIQILLRHKHKSEKKKTKSCWMATRSLVLGKLCKEAQDHIWDQVCVKLFEWVSGEREM